MNPFDTLLHQLFVARLGWTLIHFLWQGSAIALVLAVVQAVLKRGAAQTRYLAGCAALGTMLIAPLLTFSLLPDIHAPAEVLSRHTSGLATTIPASSTGLVFPIPVSVATKSGPSHLERSVSWLVIAWFIGVCGLSVRLFGGWLQLQRLRTRQIEEIGEPWLEKFEDLRRRLGISRSVQLLKSALVQVPTVIGWLRPVILLPASTLTGLTPGQLESVLAHELAHVRRNDYLVNLIQRIVETLLFYHPAVWWVSKCIREERELCCDDVVVHLCGDRLNYARALATLEQYRSSPTGLALAATDGSLGNRIRRLLQRSPQEQGHNWRRILALLTVGSVLVVLAARPDLVFWHKVYRSTVRISLTKEVDPSQQASPWPGLNERTSSDPYWIQTEFEKIKSRPVLYAVIEKLNLNQRWARRYGADVPLKTAETFQILVKNVETRQSRNMSLIEIIVHSEDPREAAEIANEIAKTYADIRASASRNSISILRTQLENQKKMLSEAEQRMDAARSTLGVTDPGSDEVPHSVEPEAVRVFERNRAEMEVKLADFESLLTKLQNIPRDQLANSIPTSSYPDARLTELLSQLDQAERQFAQTTEEYGAEHSKVRSISGTIKKVREQIDARLTGILSQLQIEVERHREQLNLLTKRISEARRLDSQMTEKYHPYLEAKRDYETKLRIYETINLRILQETVDAQLPRRSHVEIVDPAETSPRPVRGWF